VVLKAPQGTSKRQINSFLAQHAAGFRRKMRYGASFSTRAALRFVEGELSGWLEQSRSTGKQA
jgi:hypothetical protein